MALFRSQHLVWIMNLLEFPLIFMHELLWPVCLPRKQYDFYVISKLTNVLSSDLSYLSFYWCDVIFFKSTRTSEIYIVNEKKQRFLHVQHAPHTAFWILTYLFGNNDVKWPNRPSLHEDKRLLCSPNFSFLIR